MNFADDQDLLKAGFVIYAALHTRRRSQASDTGQGPAAIPPLVVIRPGAFDQKTATSG